MSDDLNHGIYADPLVADQWIAWIEGIKGLKSDVRAKDIYPFLNDWLKQIAPKTVLEIGSGQGDVSERLELGTAHYIGVEPSKRLRERAHELYPTKDFRGGIAEKLPVENESIDAAYSTFVWFHILDLDAAAKELARVLNPRGSFAIVTANPEQYPLWIKWHQNASVNGKELRGDMQRLSNDLMYLHSLDEMKQSFEKAGLSITDVRSVGWEFDHQDDPGFALIIAGQKV